jgi:hypothetical protein
VGPELIVIRSVLDIAYTTTPAGARLPIFEDRFGTKPEDVPGAKSGFIYRKESKWEDRLAPLLH